MEYGSKNGMMRKLLGKLGNLFVMLGDRMSLRIVGEPMGIVLDEDLLQLVSWRLMAGHKDDSTRRGILPLLRWQHLQPC